MGQLKTPPYIKTGYMSSLIDIEAYHGDLIIHKTPGQAYQVGKVYQTPPLTGGGGEFASVVVNLFKGLPDGAILQVNELCFPDDEVAQRYRQGKQQANPVVAALIERQASLFERASSPGVLPSVPFLNDKLVLLAFMVPCKNLDERTLGDMELMQQGFLTSIRHCGFKQAQVVTPPELAGRFRQFIHLLEPYAPVALDPLLEWKHQLYGPNESLDFRDREMGRLNEDTLCCGVTVKYYPKQSDMGLMNLVIGAPLQESRSTREGGGSRINTPYILNTTLRIANQEEEAKRVAQAIESRTNRPEKFEMLFRFGQESAADKLRDLQYLQANCSRDDNQYVYASTNLFLFGHDAKTLRNERQTLVNRMNALGFDAREIGHDLLPRFCNSWPMNYSPLIADKLESECLMTAAAAATLLPIYGDWRGNAHLGQRGGSFYVTRRGQPHAFDVSYSQGAFNGYVYGGTGRGKTATLLYKILNELAQGSMVVFFDNSRSALLFCRAVGGEYQEFTPHCELTYSLNPFAGIDMQEFELYECENIVRLLLLMAYENGVTDEFASIAMREAVVAAFKHNPMNASIDSVISALEQARHDHPIHERDSKLYQAKDNLVPRLKAFMNNEARSRFFIGNCPLDPNAQFTVFDLKGLDADPHLRRVVMFFLMNITKSKMARHPGRKLQIIDEAKDVLKVKTEAEAIEGQYAKGRKEGISTWVITQSPEDLDGKAHDNPCLDKIRSQSDFSILLGLKPSEVDYALAQGLINKNFADDPYYLTLLKDLNNEKGKYSELLVTTDSGFEVVRVYLEETLLWLFNSDKEHRDAVFPLLDQGMHPFEARAVLSGQQSTQRRRWIREFMDSLIDDDAVSADELLTDVQSVLAERVALGRGG